MLQQSKAGRALTGIPIGLTSKLQVDAKEIRPQARKVKVFGVRRRTLSLASCPHLLYLTNKFPQMNDELTMTIVDTRTPDPKRLIPGATGDWEVIIGLEVHAQVTSNAKLFSGSSTTFGKAPNANVSLVDAAMPGMLPVINEECVKQAVRTGLGLKAKINKRSIFDRKNYFYPDLPQGYQISQYKDPIVGEGTITISLGPDREGNFEDIEIGIERLHLEQDAGKLMHDQHPSFSFVDLNRSGVALMEIVSKPDMRSADEAKAYVTKLRTIVRYLGTCDGNMDEGSLRADVNVSVRKPGGEFGTRCEIKNVNSIRFVGMAIESEARRQIDILEEGGVIDQVDAQRIVVRATEDLEIGDPGVDIYRLRKYQRSNQNSKKAPGRLIPARGKPHIPSLLLYRRHNKTSTMPPTPQ